MPSRNEVAETTGQLVSVLTALDLDANPEFIQPLQILKAVLIEKLKGRVNTGPIIDLTNEGRGPSF